MISSFMEAPGFSHDPASIVNLIVQIDDEINMVARGERRARKVHLLPRRNKID